MKPKLIGILLLAVVVLAAGGYSFYRENGRVTVLRGYLGGEKTGLFEDEEAARILERKYHIQFDYSRAGSLDMVTADQEGMNYLFPSSQTALSYYEDVHGQPLQEEIIFNTPIVLYTHRMVLEAFEANGIVSQTDGVYIRRPSEKRCGYAEADGTHSRRNHMGRAGASGTVRTGVGGYHRSHSLQLRQHVCCPAGLCAERRTDRG